MSKTIGTTMEIMMIWLWDSDGVGVGFGEVLLLM